MSNNNQTLENCPICGSTNIEPRSEETKRYGIKFGSILKCNSCYHRIVWPQPSFEENARNFESEDYYKNTVGYKKTFFRQRVQAIKKISKVQHKRLLDIGCARGEMLVIARDAGFSVTGVEQSSYASKYAREKYGLNVLNELPDQIASSQFDIVHSNHVMEHVEDPIRFAKQIYRLLNPGGFTFIEVPNEFENLLGKIRILARQPRCLEVPSIHLHFFSPQSLKITMAYAGFNSIKIYTRTDLVGKHNRMRGPEKAFRNISRYLANIVNQGENIVFIGWK